jgi:glycosyltransferase involved in cell wall biosynthesis
MDFLVHTEQPCAYDDEIRALGSRIIPCLHPSRPFSYARNLTKILRDCGPYDIVHSHVHHYSGHVLRIAHQAGVPMRIAHSHSDTAWVQSRSGLSRRLYFALMSRWIKRHATRGIGVSRKAAAALFGPLWEHDPRWRILYYGIDLEPFRQPVDRDAVRQELNIPLDAFVVGHVGRFVEPKNHLFFVDIAAEIAKREPTAYFLLVGDGPLRTKIEEKVGQVNPVGHVVFAGARDDVPRIMLGAMDCFVFPSLFEGLGIVLIEAQAAGLPCVYSDVVPQEATVVSQLIHTLSLKQSADTWAEAILTWEQQRPRVFQPEALNCVRQSYFNIEQSVRGLVTVYDGH